MRDLMNGSIFCCTKGNSLYRIDGSVGSLPNEEFWDQLLNEVNRAEPPTRTTS